MNAQDVVTVSHVVRESWLKQDGTCFVRLRITFKRQSKFLKTSILLHTEDIKISKIKKPDGKVESKYSIKNPDLRYQAEQLVHDMEDKVSAIGTFALQGMTIDQVVSHLQKEMTEDEENFRLDFFAFADEVIAAKKGQSKKTYQSALNAFKAYVGKAAMDISELTSTVMRGFEASLQAKHGKNARCVSAYTACMAFIHGQARLKYNDEELGRILIKNPFQFYKPPRQKPARHRDVDSTLIDKMLLMRSGLKGRERLGVDVFLISFSLMGMNAPDLYHCTPPHNDILHYFRTKTRERRDDNAEMFVKIDPLVKKLLEEYKAKDKLHAFNFHSLYTSYSIFAANVNHGLDKFRKRIGYPEKVTLYWARHSWASLAYETGIDKSLINDGLCHVDKDMKVTDIYINKDWSLLWEANSKVLSKFSWNGKPKIVEVGKEEKKERMTSKQIILSCPAWSVSRRVQNF